MHFKMVFSNENIWDTCRITIIIICLYKIAILHHGIQSFHIIIYCTPVYCTLVYCTIADSSDSFATSISLREHANERYAVDVYNNSVIELVQCFGTSFFGRIDHLASSVIKFRPKNSVPKHCTSSITYTYITMNKQFQASIILQRVSSVWWGGDYSKCIVA